jgi:hypothetical protein
MNATPAASPWHRHLWPWVIIGVLTCSVGLTLAMVAIAVTHPDNLVTDNYYEAGKGINRALDRELFAHALNLSASVGVDELTGEVDVRLSGASQPETLVLNLISPTQPGKDRKVVLARNPSQSGRYVGQLSDNVEGRRFVELLGVENGRVWRLFEEERQRLTLGDEPIQGADRH